MAIEHLHQSAHEESEGEGGGEQSVDGETGGGRPEQVRLGVGARRDCFGRVVLADDLRQSVVSSQ